MKIFSVSRKVLGGLFVFLAIASIVSGAVYSIGALVVKLLIAECLVVPGCVSCFCFWVERTWDSCDSFVERLGMGALAPWVCSALLSDFRPICSSGFMDRDWHFACRSRSGAGTYSVIMGS